MTCQNSRIWLTSSKIKHQGKYLIKKLTIIKN
jgi:hypothetical protein